MLDSMQRFTIYGLTDDQEAFQLEFYAPSDIQVGDWSTTREEWHNIRRYAIEALWEQRWTPGSVEWRVYKDNVLLPVGDDFDK